MADVNELTQTAKANFDTMDLDHDGFINLLELTSGREKSLFPSNLEPTVRFLEQNYRQIRDIENDDFFATRDRVFPSNRIGITTADLNTLALVSSEKRDKVNAIVMEKALNEGAVVALGAGLLTAILTSAIPFVCPTKKGTYMAAAVAIGVPVLAGGVTFATSHNNYTNFYKQKERVASLLKVD